MVRLLKTTRSTVSLYTSFIISQIVKCNTLCIHHKYIMYLQYENSCDLAYIISIRNMSEGGGILMLTFIVLSYVMPVL